MALLEATPVVTEQRPAVDLTEGRQLLMTSEIPVVIEPHAPPLVPGEIWLGSLLDPRLKVVAPLLVRLSLDHDRVVAEAPELNEFGFGESASEAVADIQSAVVLLYFSLEEDAPRLGPDLQRTWETIQTFVSKAQTPDDQARRV